MLSYLLSHLWPKLGRILIPLRIRVAHLLYREPMFKRSVMRLDPVLKKSFLDQSHQEAPALTFVRQRTSIPVPALLDSWDAGNGMGYIRIAMCAGVELGTAWPTMSAAARARTAAELKVYIAQLRELQQTGRAGWVCSMGVQT